MKILSQYKGLRKEMYVLFFGRIVTSLGTMVHFLLTLILSNKLHMNASSIASLLFVVSVIQLPLMFLSGYLADHFNKRNIIIVCDLVTVTCYLIAGMIPLSFISIGFIIVAGLFAAIEHPVYDALVADLSSFEDREKAFSLNYLGMNLGTVLAPSIGGILFAHHLNLVFIIDALTTLASTLLIYLFIKDITVTRSEEGNDCYEEDAKNSSVFSVLKERKVIIYFIVCSVMIHILYSQFNFLMPLNFEKLYGENGAVIFGTLTSVNGLVVIIGTPLLVVFASRLKDIHKILCSEILIVAGYTMYIFIQGMMPLYYVSMIIFTLGEILNTLGTQPYLTRRIPTTHRGRISSMTSVFAGISVAIAQKGIGYLIDQKTMVEMWTFISILGVITIVMICILCYYDKKEYPLLYEKKNV